MSKKFLGESIVDIKDTPYKDYTQNDWALYFIAVYGGFDGSHHKDWALDQVARVLNGTNVIIKLAKWDNGQEQYQISTEENPSEKYNEWVKNLIGEYDEPYYNVGIAP